jgi:hypothetical protein
MVTSMVLPSPLPAVRALSQVQATIHCVKLPDDLTSFGLPHLEQLVADTTITTSVTLDIYTKLAVALLALDTVFAIVNSAIDGLGTSKLTSSQAGVGKGTSVETGIMKGQIFAFAIADFRLADLAIFKPTVIKTAVLKPTILELAVLETSILQFTVLEFTID